MSEEDQPPEEIWHHGERIRDWMEEVKRRWANPAMRPVEEDSDDMLRNELVDEYLKER
jgi:hypothetical protein